MPERRLRAAHIWCKDAWDDRVDGSYGSGYLVGPDLVLTALHVLFDPKTTPKTSKVPAGRTCIVRIHRDAESTAKNSDGGWFGFMPEETGTLTDRGWYAGELVWPTAGNPIWQHDVALVRITDAKWQRQVEDDVCPGYGGDMRPEEDVVAYGYPVFQKRTMPDGEFYELTPAEGATVEWADRRQAPMFSTQKLSPKIAEEWGGMSGAALWWADRIIGVIHARHDKLANNNGVRYYPLSRIPPSSPFWATFGQRGEAAPEIITTQFDIEHEIRNLDRQPEETDFGVWVRRLSVPTARLVLLPGHRDDELDLCIDRFARVLTTEYSKHKELYSERILTGAGSASQPRAERLVSMLSGWATSVKKDIPYDDLLDQEKMEAVIRERTTKDGKPRLIVIEHGMPRFSASCVDLALDLAQVLRRLPMDPPLIVIMKVLLGIRSAEERELGLIRKIIWPEKEADFAGICQTALKALLDESLFHRLKSPSDCEPYCVTNWFDSIRKAHRLKPAADPSYKEYETNLKPLTQYPLGTAITYLKPLKWERV